MNQTKLLRWALMFWTGVFMVLAFGMYGCGAETRIRGVTVYRTDPGVPSDDTIDAALGHWERLHGSDALDGLTSISFHDKVLPGGAHGLYDTHYLVVWVYWRRDCIDMSVLYHELAHHTFRLYDGPRLEKITVDSWLDLLMSYRCLGGELTSNTAE